MAIGSKMWPVLDAQRDRPLEGRHMAQKGDRVQIDECRPPHNSCWDIGSLAELHCIATIWAEKVHENYDAQW